MASNNYSGRSFFGMTYSRVLYIRTWLLVARGEPGAFSGGGGGKWILKVWERLQEPEARKGLMSGVGSKLLNLLPGCALWQRSERERFSRTNRWGEFENTSLGHKTQPCTRHTPCEESCASVYSKSVLSWCSVWLSSPPW